MAGEHLKGRYRVRAIRPAFDDVNRLMNRIRDKMELRYHALKLRYWPDVNPTDQGGQLLDLDWTWVRALPGSRIGELRVHDEIGGNNNLRILFFVGEPIQENSLPIIWILRVIQKKRDDFSVHELAIFKARKSLVIERFYRYRS